MPTLRTPPSGPSVSAPTRVGTPTSSTAPWMSSNTVGSLNGSMSVEFSGQITRSAWRASPAATCAAYSSVASTWLFRTARRSANASIPSPGTFPCTAATTTVRASSFGPGARGCAKPDPREADRQVAATAADARTGVRRTITIAHANTVDTRATAKVTPADPTYANSGATGAVSYTHLR